jgi:hypothetical protein
MKQMNTVQNMTLTEYFEKWFNTAVKRKAAQGVSIEITFVEFMNQIVTPRQYESLQKTKDEGWLNTRQRHDNPLAYVITWKSYSARSSNVFSVETACFCTRTESKSRAKPKKGEKLSDTHKQNISKGLKDKPKSEEHKQSISDSLKGREFSQEHKSNLKKPKAPWSEERKAARSALLAAKKKEKNNG